MSTEIKGIGEANLIHVTDESFSSNVLRAPLITVVDFTADWCPPCRALAPVYERLSVEFAGRMRFARLDVDEYQIMMTHYRVLGAPTLIFFKDGEEVERLVGPHPGRLRGHIERILAESVGAV